MSGPDKTIIQTPSLKHRYIAKLTNNLFGLVLTFITISLVPRALGPAAYGAFEFLRNFFEQVAGFLDMGTSTAFYTKLSQRMRDIGLIRFYMIFVGFVLTLMGAGLLLVAWLVGFSDEIWQGQPILYIALAMLLGYFTWSRGIAQKIVDAFGCTITSERAAIVVKGISTIVVVVLFATELLTIESYFAVEIALAIVLILTWGRIARYHWVAQDNAKIVNTKNKALFAEFRHYCTPLFWYALVGLFVGLADRWLLQLFAGSEEQGFYSLAYRVSAVCFIFTSAMTQLIMREFARAHAEGDYGEMRRLFRRYIPMLYAVAAYFSAFISVEAETVIWILGGDEFVAAGAAMMIMALYPIHQTYGQLSGSLFFATGQTRLYRNIGITVMLIGLPITWFVLAPRDMGGIDEGSFGLAIKMVIVQFLGVNLQLWLVQSPTVKSAIYKISDTPNSCHCCVLYNCLVGVYERINLGIASMDGIYGQRPYLHIYDWCCGIHCSTVAWLAS